MKTVRLILAVFAVAAIPAYAGTALSLGSAAGYNVFVLGAYSTPGGTDIQGSVAVGGSMTASGSLSINESPGSANPSNAGLIVGGSLALAGGQLDNGNAGNAWVGGSVTSSGYFNFEKNLSAVGSIGTSNIVVGGTKTSGGSVSIPSVFLNAASNLDQLSTSLTGLAANGTVSVNYSTITLSASGCTLCVFDLSGGNASGETINISAPAGATVVINVAGTSDSISNGSINYTGGATANDTLFNFGAATTLATSGETIYGSILAPLACFTGTNGSIDGELIANTVTGETAEFESGDIFNGNLGSAAAPEPSTWILMGTASLICFFIRKRRLLADRLERVAVAEVPQPAAFGKHAVSVRTD